MVSGPNELPESLSVGVEIADAATRLTAIAGDAPVSERLYARLPMPPAPGDAILHITDLVRRAFRERAAAGEMPNEVASVSAVVGVALRGEVDASNGVVRALPPLTAWSGFPLAERLSHALGVPVWLDTGTNAGALAEAQRGAGVNHRSLLYVHLGRGVTSAFVVNGKIVRGGHGSAGSLGHSLVCPDGPRCSCGLRGHLEPIASAQSIVRAMIGRAARSDESTAAMLRVSGGRAEAMSAAQVVQLAITGEPVAQEVVSEATHALATALANAVLLVDPGVIVLDGPLVEAGEAFLGPLRVTIEMRLPRTGSLPMLATSTLYPWTALLGARLLASVSR
jgi:glucokinase